MGFDKKHISKEGVLANLKNDDDSKGTWYITSLGRQMKIDMLFKADALIMDMWVSRFYHDLNPEERKIREGLNEKYKFSSSNNFINDSDYKNLNSLSECLISLMNTPNWIDIFITIDKLKLKISEEESGRADLLQEKCIDAIINHFD